MSREIFEGVDMRRGAQRRMKMRALGLVGVWWGRPPGPRPTPPLAFVNRRKKPARGPAADQGVCPTMLYGLSSRPFSRESQAADVHRRLAH
jgi:hypothetical protein